MAEPQGLFTFPGLVGIRKASYTLTHGVSPSVALVEMLPVLIRNIHGTMRFSYGTTNINFPGAKIISATLRKSGAGWVTVVKIADRRWKFADTGEISGVFNLRKEDESIDADTEKTPQQIATLCFEAMEETQFSISDLPNLSRPEIILENENPAQTLASLCQSLGCRVVLGTDNKMSVRQAGVGAGLPTDKVMSPSFSTQVPDVPDSIKVVGGKTRVQSRWDLEAVGKDTDGSIKLIDDLSYTPADGWNSDRPESWIDVLDENDKKAHALAKQTVYKWYRITTTNVPDPLPRKEALPIESELLETYTDDDGKIRPKKATVRGVYWPRSDEEENTSATILVEVDGDFSIDTKEGIVQFSEPVYKLSGDNNDRDPADLTLEVAWSQRLSSTNLLVQFEHERTISFPSRGTGPLIIKRGEIVNTVRLAYTDDGSIDPDGTVDNIDEVVQEAEYEIDAKQNEFQQIEAFTADYAGLIDISPDGTIHQVSWEVGDATITRAALNTEFDPAILKYKRRRELEEQIEAAKEAKKLKRAIRRAVLRGQLPGVYI